MSKRLISFERLELAIQQLLIAIEEDPTRPGLEGTPRRVADFWDKFLTVETDGDRLNTSFEVGHTPSQLIVVKDIVGYSMCEHHLLPFSFTSTVGYLTGSRVPGLSKIPRVVLKHAHRLQIQERMTSDIADELMARFELKGVGVTIEGQHLCCQMRGVQQPSMSFITSSLRGEMLTDTALKAEFLEFRRS